MPPADLAKANSVVIWRGESLLDGAPIVVIATGFTVDSKNTKTGPMVQIYILHDALSPPQAILEGADKAICGGCALRGDGTGLGRSCYVQVKWAPLGLWKIRNSIPEPAVSDPDYDIAHLFKDRYVRLGAYGDPAAVPYMLWRDVTQLAVGWTGYTHQWRRCDPRLKGLCMASVDSSTELILAQSFGWRTFRTRSELGVAEPNEIVCPASEEAGHRTTCAKCNLCDGRRNPVDRRTSITIIAHGSRTARYGIPLLPFEDQIDGSTEAD